MFVEGLEAKPLRLEAVPYLLKIEVDDHRMGMVWAARHRLRIPITSSRLAEVAAGIQVSWKGR
jgi:hypothetical protein